MGVRTRYTIRDAYVLEERIQFLVFTAPISLHSNDLLAKESLNQIREILETLKYFKYVFNDVNPYILAEVIYETYIVMLSTNRLRGRAQTLEKTQL
jgi:hypothetical protein